jgi:hypothetical protein
MNDIATLRTVDSGDGAQLRKALALALAPLLRAYVRATDCATMPECFDGEVITATGFKGGNRSHGGKLEIGFSIDSTGANRISCTADRDSASVTLSACGDWEQAGLICALAELLADILPRYYPDKPRF